MNDMKMLRFRESFRGYNKDDVNAYIEQINLRFSRKESELRAQIADLQTLTKHPIPAEPVQTPPVAAEPSPELQALRDTIVRLTAENDALRAEIEKASAAPVSDDADSAEKSRLYDSMSAQVGNILIVANNNAERILDEAKAEADRIRGDARFFAESERKKAEERMTVKVAELEARLDRLFRSCIADYECYVTDAGVRLVTITESMRERTKELLLSADQQMKTIMQEDLSNTDTE